LLYWNASYRYYFEVLCAFRGRQKIAAYWTLKYSYNIGTSAGKRIKVVRVRYVGCFTNLGKKWKDAQSLDHITDFPLKGKRFGKTAPLNHA
jgi:hypothetical protein